MKVVLCVCICLLPSLGFVLSNPVSQNSSAEYIDVAFTPPPNAGEIQHAYIGAKRCMKQLGCFEITRDFYHAINRPVNLLPQDPASINTQFKLYTKSYPMEVHLLNMQDPEGMKESHINPEHKTIFIVHGFLDSTFYGKWMENLKTHLLIHGSFNIIIVDWSKGNGLPYTQATANTRVVGAQIALLIEYLEKTVGISPMNCHIIGHSLGSHIAGYAGERLKSKKLGRITALDPAKPFFENMPASVRIDPTDADFVDAIHTDSASAKVFAFGMSQAVGHVDFYPNSGGNQPGCLSSKLNSILLEGLFDAARQFVACNHQRAIEFFVHSLNFKKIAPVSHQCPSWKDYREGRCSDCGKNGERCAIMGMKAEEFKKFKDDSRSIKMYLSTAGSAPYWVNTYQISLKLARPEGYKDKSGNIKLILQGSKSDYNVDLSTRSGELIHGSTYTFFIGKQEELGNIKSVLFKWTRSWSINPLNYFKTHTIYLDFVKVTPMSIIDKVTREKTTKKFCYKSTKAIETNRNVLLTECN